jgi:hypothetical protein
MYFTGNKEIYMDSSQVFETVTNIISTELDVDKQSLTPQTEFKDLGADSFDLLSLITAFEDEFGSTLNDDILQNIKTINDAVDAIVNAQ